MVGHFEQFIDLLLVFGEHHAAPRVVDHVGDVVGGIGLVDTDAARFQQLRAQVGEQPFRPVVAQDSDMVTRADVPLR